MMLTRYSISIRKVNRNDPDKMKEISDLINQRAEVIGFTSDTNSPEWYSILLKSPIK